MLPVNFSTLLDQIHPWGLANVQRFRDPLYMKFALLNALLLVTFLSASPLSASVITFGTEDCLTTNCYGASDPTAGATLQGLSAGSMTSATTSFGHSFPFAPTPGDFSGTDQIYVGSNQTAQLDGYSGAAQRMAGPLVLTLDYSPEIPQGQQLDTLTLGLALDDFQPTALGQPFTVSIDGTLNTALTTFVNTLNETGPQVQFFTFGLNTALDNSNHVLTVSIDEGGNGGDGFAVDFATVGVTTSAASSVPEPGTAGLFAIAALAALAGRRLYQRCSVA
jgi:hypothetical protein